MTTEKCLIEESEKKPRLPIDVTTASGKTFHFESILTEECEKSPDKMHCWHLCAPSEVFIPGGTSTVHEFCCWCGTDRSYEIEIRGSYSVVNRKHGPHYKETYII